jgi:hypothetical protein
VVLIAADVPYPRSMELLDLSERIVRQMIKDISSGKTPIFLIAKGGGRKPELLSIQQVILDEINTNIYTSYIQIVDWIKTTFKIVTLRSAVADFLKKNGIKRLKCGSLPEKQTL